MGVFTTPNGSTYVISNGPDALSPKGDEPTLKVSLGAMLRARAMLARVLNIQDATSNKKAHRSSRREHVFEDFKHDFSLAARRASKDAFNQLQKQIRAAPALQ